MRASPHNERRNPQGEGTRSKRWMDRRAAGGAPWIGAMDGPRECLAARGLNVTPPRVTPTARQIAAAIISGLVSHVIAW